MIEACLFDVFGTLVDWRSGVADVARPMFAKRRIDVDPAAFASRWRGEYDPAMARVRSGARGYVPLDDLHLENLDRTLAHFEIAAQFNEGARADLNRAWEQLPPWPDTAAGLAAIRAERIVAPCSNGSIALMTRLARHSGLVWDCILGAEVARDYKPSSQVYLASCAALALPPERVLMVAAHNGDLHAARALGMHTAFIPRLLEHGPGQTADLVAEADWDFIAADLTDLAAQLR